MVFLFSSCVHWNTFGNSKCSQSLNIKTTQNNNPFFSSENSNTKIYINEYGQVFVSHSFTNSNLWTPILAGSINFDILDILTAFGFKSSMQKQEILEKLKGKKVLSLGEGISPFLPFLKKEGIHVKAIDPIYFLKNSNSISLFTQNPRYKNSVTAKRVVTYMNAHFSDLIEGSIEKLPFEDESFDFLFSHSVLHYLMFSYDYSKYLDHLNNGSFYNNRIQINKDSFSKVEKVLAEVLRVLKKDGEAYISFPFLKYEIEKEKKRNPQIEIEWNNLIENIRHFLNSHPIVAHGEINFFDIVRKGEIKIPTLKKKIKNLIVDNALIVIRSAPKDQISHAVSNHISQE